MQPAENAEHGKHRHQPDQLQHGPNHDPAPSLVASRGKTADLRLDLPVPLPGDTPAVALHDGSDSAAVLRQDIGTAIAVVVANLAPQNQRRNSLVPPMANLLRLEKIQ